MSFGFKPEPITIPPPAASAALELPLQSAGLSAAGAFSDASSSCLTGTTTTSGLEPLEQLGSTSEIQYSDLQVLHNIGHGSSGVVQKVLHVPSDSVLALKVIPVEADEAKRRQILLELKTLHESMHPSIVSFYGAFFREGAVHVALEYMDASLLDISRASAGVGIPEQVLGAIAAPVLHGLVYMHREKHLIHRDIKPSNLLVDATGHVKIADFGVSGELHETLAKCASWVGTVHYMSPERISGGTYSYDSDVWSFGITMLELATARFPYPHEHPDGRRLSFWDLLDAIVESPPPTPPSHFSPPFHSFISACLKKEPSSRATSSQLLEHPLILGAHGAHHPPGAGAPPPIDIAAWLRDALAALPPRSGVDDADLSSGAGAAEMPWMQQSLTGGLGSTQPLGGGGGLWAAATAQQQQQQQTMDGGNVPMSDD